MVHVAHSFTEAITRCRCRSEPSSCAAHLLRAAKAAHLAPRFELLHELQRLGLSLRALLGLHGAPHEVCSTAVGAASAPMTRVSRRGWSLCPCLLDTRDTTDTTDTRDTRGTGSAPSRTGFITALQSVEQRTKSASSSCKEACRPGSAVAVRHTTLRSACRPQCTSRSVACRSCGKQTVRPCLLCKVCQRLLYIPSDARLGRRGMCSACTGVQAAR